MIFGIIMPVMGEESQQIREKGSQKIHGLFMGGMLQYMIDKICACTRRTGIGENEENHEN